MGGEGFHSNLFAFPGGRYEVDYPQPWKVPLTQGCKGDDLFSIKLFGDCSSFHFNFPFHL